MGRRRAEREQDARGREPAERRSDNPLLVVFTVMMSLALVAGVAGAGGWWWLQRAFAMPGPSSEETVVELPRGAGLIAIANRLESEGVITDARLFRALVTIDRGDRSLQAGEYAIPAGASMNEVYDQLREGDVRAYSITFPEGWRTDQIIAAINASEYLTGEIERMPGEGELLPETYLIQRGMARQELVDHMARAQDQVLDALWPTRADDLPYASREEAIIAASIVERETGRSDEQPLVAAVVRNRLLFPQRLEMDSTANYGELLRDPDRPLNIEPDLAELDDASNLYNTYRHDGLPPGPIANPGRAAIAATLNPPEDAEARAVRYFVRSCEGGGRHNFSADYNVHTRYVREWRRCERAVIAADAG